MSNINYRDNLDTIEFHDLMSSYRMCDQSNQDEVVKRFENIKKFIREKAEFISNALKRHQDLIKSQNI